MFERESNEEQRRAEIEEVIAMYQTLEQFFKSEEFDDDSKNMLMVSNPNYLQVLEKRKRDIKRSDHGIVIAGMSILIRFI